MNPTPRILAPGRALLAVAALAFAAASCGTKLIPMPVTNLLPEVRLTSAPIDTTSQNFYSVTLNWIGHDPDGRVDHYLYAIDPPEEGSGQDTAWVLTRENERRQTFSASKTGPAPDTLRSRDFHTFVIAAVDDDGAMGPRVHRDFYAYTAAPTVQIESPRPNRLLTPVLTPAVRITWSGDDPDGVFTTRPVRYRYRLFNLSNDLLPGGEPAKEIAEKPWLIRAYYAPDFAASENWIQTSAETTFVQFTNLNPGSEYMFVVTAFDEAGAHTPTFSLLFNMLRFKVGYAGTNGPVLTIFNEYVFYRYPGASYYPGPSSWIDVEVPAGQKVRVNWFADPPPGADIRYYRWMLDGDVFDETPRADEETDLKHWSARSRNVQTAEVGPFGGDEEHFFYVEAGDNIGLRSLGVLHMRTVQATLERPLMIVNDTRFRADVRLPNGTYDKPKGPWPVATELDTFLFAYGGWQWRQYPEGTFSTPGVLKGYPFVSAAYPFGDVYNTRIGRTELTVPLSVIGKYQHVLWITDGTGATYTKGGTDLTQPETALRYMSGVGRVNTLGAYVKQGGRVWAAGGGVAMASTNPHNDRTNDQPTITYSAETAPNEVRPGRFMYDLAKWRSEYRIARARTNPRRYLGRYDEVGNPGVYAQLPLALEAKTPATDTLPPQRVASDFYQTFFNLEFLQRGNIVEEALQTDPVDFQIDNFGYPGTAELAAVWQSSDVGNTVATSAAGSNGNGMRITTQGGGGSTGDRVRRTFESYRDWSGLTQMRFTVRQDQPASAVQWRVRIIDEDGGGFVAPVPWSGGAGFQNVTIPLYGFTSEIGRVPSLTRVAALEFELVRGDAAANTDFDQIAISATFEVPVLDTLYRAPGGGSTTLPDPTVNPHNVVMTYYHGHDSPPFLFSGFSLWDFRRSQVTQLFDFVFQRMWGLSRTTAAPALRADRAARQPVRAIRGPAAPMAQTPGAASVDSRRLSRGQAADGGSLRPNRGPSSGK
jgi:hypothetical protein